MQHLRSFTTGLALSALACGAVTAEDDLPPPPPAAQLAAELAVPAGPHDWLIEHPTILRLLKLHNQTRSRSGRQPLVLNTEMCLAAQRHANQMATSGRFAHSGLPYRENIAYRQRTADHAVRTWNASPGHFNNMLSGSHVGFGYAVRNGVGYWVAVFR